MCRVFGCVVSTVLGKRHHPVQGAGWPIRVLLRLQEPQQNEGELRDKTVHHNARKYWKHLSLNFLLPFRDMKGKRMIQLKNWFGFSLAISWRPILMGCSVYLVILWLAVSYWFMGNSYNFVLGICQKSMCCAADAAVLSNMLLKGSATSFFSKVLLLLSSFSLIKPQKK